MITEKKLQRMFEHYIARKSTTRRQHLRARILSGALENVKKQKSG